ncbi:MAG: amino acid decarboxylase [Lachnospiraceae bacterium]|nr:amino acid decarboxylase [Lachnospiraceae bacterium]
MTTPIVDFLKHYQSSDVSRLHMPGHKGQPYLGPEPLDITEVKGADELYFAESIIAQSEANATRLFGTGLTLYSTEGSSHGIRSMIMLACQLTRSRCAGNPANDSSASEPAGTAVNSTGTPIQPTASAGSCRRILAARNAHKAFLFAAALCNLEVDWIYPSLSDENSAASCQITPELLEQHLTQMQTQGTLPFAVYITSPDYLGHCADVKTLAKICHRFGALLLVDNAHGAYLHFLPEKLHPMDLGADLCCDSAHKTLPVLTGGAYLHVREGLCSRQQAKNVMAVTGTSSPSYLLMASLDICNEQLGGSYPERMQQLIREVKEWKAQAAVAGIPLLPSEELKIVVNAAALGYTGSELGELLRKHQAEPEFCDHDFLVCMLTPDTRPVDLQRLMTALLEAVASPRPARDLTPLRLARLPRACSIREAVFAPQDMIPVQDSIGRICGSPAVSCPPAIPLAVSGEVITSDAVRMMEAYGIEEISVVIE